MSVITKLEESSNFEKFLQTQPDNNLVVLFFTAKWSDESQLMSNVLDELAKGREAATSRWHCIAIEAEDHEDITLKYGVEMVPTFVFLKNKTVLYKLAGANPAELREKLDTLEKSLDTLVVAAATAATVKSDGGEANDLNTRLKRLINSSPVIVFIKGSPSEPRCGFSRQIVEILKKQTTQFGFFDILSDNEVREGLKKYSNWPTYPQLYVKGELVGGLDIVKELVESGELAGMLPPAPLSINDRLKSLVNKAKVMLFMKGSAESPQCGFSRQIVDILNKTGAKYDTFDILSDEEVRQNLKEYSKWPTYPQLYVDGELVGGLDIVKELRDSGELEASLKGSAEK